VLKFRMPFLATALTSLITLFFGVVVAGSGVATNATPKAGAKSPGMSAWPTVASSPTSAPTATATSSPATTTATYTVPSSIASDCSVDVTSSLLSWIGLVPNGSTLEFGSGKCYRVERVLEFRGRTNLVFEGNGSAFRSYNAMTSGSYAADQRAMWRVIASTGIVLDNMSLTGAYAHGGTLDSSLQHAHGVDVRGSSVEISHVKVGNVAGDCFYLGLGYDNATRSSGSVHDSSCSSAGRNGIALTAANKVTVSTNSFGNLGYTAVDLEPNVGFSTASTGWGTSDVSVSSNTIGNYRLYAFAVIENAPNTGITFADNTVTASSGLRIGVVSPGGSVRPSNITIQSNTASTSTWAPAMDIKNVDGLSVTGNTVPIHGGTMAAIDSGCVVDVSSNSYPGGSSQVSIANPAC
jgi:hypothetical protein